MNVYQYVYIARHGATVANHHKIVQRPDEPLSEVGHAQAARLAERARNLSFEHLLASDYQRAEQTAIQIAEVTEKEIITEPLLREFGRPTSFHGASRESEQFKTFLATEIANHSNPDWKYEDGETYFEAAERANEALDFFARYGSDSLFVVSHGVFIRFIAAGILLKREPMPQVWSSISRSLNMHNTGITIVRRDIETNEWFLVTWNDHAHFAE
ncbi:MAG: histidine phosphatase family protein [Patescibacteria group bacterium]